MTMKAVIYSCNLSDFMNDLIVDTVKLGNPDLRARWVAALLWNALDDPFELVEELSHYRPSLDSVDTETRQ